jgi:hypothetical protein
MLLAAASYDPRNNRWFEIDWSVKGAEEGKTIIWWNCSIRIHAVGAAEYSDLEISLNACTADTACADAIKHAKA